MGIAGWQGMDAGAAVWSSGEAGEGAEAVTLASSASLCKPGLSEGRSSASSVPLNWCVL